eukprot:scaffold27739_cov60-Attheya_sp.AAC.2
MPVGRKTGKKTENRVPGPREFYGGIDPGSRLLHVHRPRAGGVQCLSAEPSETVDELNAYRT